MRVMSHESSASSGDRGAGALAQASLAACASDAPNALRSRPSPTLTSDLEQLPKSLAILLASGELLRGDDVVERREDDGEILAWLAHRSLQQVAVVVSPTAAVAQVDQEIDGPASVIQDDDPKASSVAASSCTGSCFTSSSVIPLTLRRAPSSRAQPRPARGSPWSCSVRLDVDRRQHIVGNDSDPFGHSNLRGMSQDVTCAEGERPWIAATADTRQARTPSEVIRCVDRAFRTAGAGQPSAESTSVGYSPR
jgi:hypothetical protein